MRDGNLRSLFRKHVPGHWQSIETGGVGRGVPDSNYCISGKEGWVEFKSCCANRVGLRAEQVAWIHRRSREGGTVWIAVRQSHSGGPRKGSACDKLYIVRGVDVVTLHQQGLPSTRSYCWEGGPQGWDWGTIRKLLASDAVPLRYAVPLRESPPEEAAEWLSRSRPRTRRA